MSCGWRPLFCDHRPPKVRTWHSREWRRTLAAHCSPRFIEYRAKLARLSAKARNALGSREGTEWPQLAPDGGSQPPS